MKKIAFIILSIFFITTCFSQESMRFALSSSGSSSKFTNDSNNYLIHQSIGQASVIGNYSNENYTVLQGFIKPPIFNSFVIHIENQMIQDSALKALVYPIPFTEEINILLDEEVINSVLVTIFNMNGSIVFKNEFFPKRTIRINLDFLPRAPYILLISTNEKQFKTNLLKN